jgi:hypothetical protein
MKMQKSVCVCLVCLLLLLAFAGCQAVQKQGAAPETVVAEGKGTCTFSYLTTLHPGKIVSDPELVYVTYGNVHIFGYDCGDPYMDSDCVRVTDYWGEPDKESFTSMDECVTTEGGVWIGTAKGDGGDTLQHDYLGKGKYKGLKLSFLFDIPTSTADYRVTKLPGE